jgi:hypothetical protein
MVRSRPGRRPAARATTAIDQTLSCGGRRNTGSVPMQPSHPQVGVTKRMGGIVATLLVFHEVDDVEHWLRSPKREEVFGPLGITGRLFTDPAKTNRVGLIVEIPDMETFQQLMQSDEAAEAMRFDGVRPDTLVFLEEASGRL